MLPKPWITGAFEQVFGLAGCLWSGLSHNPAMRFNACCRQWWVWGLSVVCLPAWALEQQVTFLLASPTVIRGVQVGVDAPRVGVMVDLYGREGWSAGLALDATWPQGYQARERSAGLRFSAPLRRFGEAELSLSAQVQAFAGQPASRRWNYMTLGATVLQGPWAVSWFVVPAALAAERPFFAGQAVDIAWQRPLPSGLSLEVSGGWVEVQTNRLGRYHHAQVGLSGALGALEWQAAWGRTDASGRRLYGTRAQEGYRLSVAWAL